MFSVLISGLSGPGWSGLEPWPGRLCCVLTVPLSTQVYKWVPANFMLRGRGNPTMD